MTFWTKKPLNNADFPFTRPQIDIVREEREREIDDGIVLVQEKLYVDFR